MISPDFNIIRTNKIGKPYIQTTDPSLTKKMTPNDIWMNPNDGSMKAWDGTGWLDIQFGGSVILDDCISNRMLANDISASKITTGVLRSQDGSFYLDLITGEARLLNLVLGGQVEGNIIATSSNGLTRVRLRGREGTKDITAGVIFEQREDATDDEGWVNAGQAYFDYANRQTHSVYQKYQIGVYNASRPNSMYNDGSENGLMFRALSTDWLRAMNVTFHGAKLMKRTTRSDSFAAVNPVLNAIGNCMSGTAVACNGTVSCTYQMNDIMRLDFNIKITTAGSGSSAYGISRNLIRQLNAEIPVITPISGGQLQIFSSAGALSTSYIGASLVANGDVWTPAMVSNGALAAIAESSMTANITLVGTCYGTYDFQGA